MDRQEQNLEYIRKMRLMDDEFMSKVFDDDPESTEHILKIILQREDIHVLSVKTQFSVHSLEGHSVRLDILAKDDNGVLFNVEIQRADEGAGQKRARYYSGLLDSMALGKGEDYNALADTYVIFITEHDVLKEGKAVYHVERMIDGQKPFGDGSHIVYVNGSYRGNTAIGDLMHDFSCTSSDDIKDPLLQRRAKYFKETTEGVASVSRLMEQMRKEEAIQTFANAIRGFIKMFDINAEQAMEIANVPAELRSAVLAAL